MTFKSFLSYLSAYALFFGLLAFLQSNMEELRYFAHMSTITGLWIFTSCVIILLAVVGLVDLGSHFAKD